MALGALLAAGALLVLRPARGLSVAGLAPPPDLDDVADWAGWKIADWGFPPEQQSKARRAAISKALLSDEDLIAGGRDADEDDDFDTWMLEMEADNVFDPDGDGTWRGPSKKEVEARQWAQDRCGLPDTGMPNMENGVVVYLVTRSEDFWMLTESLPRLRYYLLRNWPYPVKIFIPSDGLREYDPESYHSSPSRIRVTGAARKFLGNDYDWEVTTFDLRFPEVIEGDPAWKSKMNTCAQAVSTSYKHMNQFFTKGMYEHESLQQYRYYLRLDADFSFKYSLRRDPFCLMAKTGRKYVWQTRRHVSDERCAEGLWDWFQKYQQDNDLTPQDLSFWRQSGGRVTYVGYVGMGDFDFFRSERVRKLSRALNEDGRVYLNRWSDQTYYVLLLALFENHTAVGDAGFWWRDEWFCHKCKHFGTFDPVTGEVHFRNGLTIPSESSAIKTKNCTTRKCRNSGINIRR